MGLLSELGINVGSSGSGAMSFTAGINTVITILIYTVFLGFVFVIGYFVWNIMRYRHHVRIMDVAHNRKIVIHDRAKEYKDKDGVPCWKLLKSKDIISVPPPDSVEVDHKGRKCVVLYRPVPGHYIFAKDVAEVKDPPKNILDMPEGEKKKKELEKYYKDHKIIHAYQPLSSVERSFLVGQIVKAKSRRTISLLDQLVPIANTGMFVILIIIMVVSWEDLTGPAAGANSVALEIEKQRTDQLSIMREMKQDIQIIKSQGLADSIKPPDVR